jgi:O-antigen/teichoic acid export membrane protein
MRFLTQRLTTEAGVLAARIIGVAAGIVTSAITARSLGPAERGEYFYVVAVAATLAQFGHLGVPGSNTYFVAQFPSAARRVTVYSLALALFMTAAATASFTAVAWFSPGTVLAPQTGGGWLVPLTFGVLATLLFSSVLAGQQRFKQLNLTSILGNAILLVWFVVVAVRNATAEAFLAASAVVTVVGALLLATLAVGQAGGGEASVGIAQWLGYGRRAYLVLLLGALVPKLGIIAMKLWSTPIELGYYSIAVQIFDAMAILPSSIALVLFPSILRSRTINWQSCKSEIIRIAMMSTALAIPAAFAMPFAVRLVFGSAFVPASYATFFFLPGFVLLAVTTAASQFLAAIAYPSAVALNWALCIVTLSITCAWLVPVYGAAGAAAGTSLAYGMAAILMVRTARRLLPVSSEA